MLDTSYTDAEICDFYRNSRDDPHIIRKISQLALKPEDEIITILHTAGHALDIKRAPQRHKPGKSPAITDNVWRKIIADRLNGVDFAKICTVYHASHSYIKNNWRKKAKELGIPLPDHKISSGVQCIPDKIRKEVDEMEEKKTEILRESLDNETPADFAISASFFLKSQKSNNFKIEVCDGVGHLDATFPVKEATV